jgi:ABC-2 type transport system permease protein/oleandomycin transport system permease protein
MTVVSPTLDETIVPVKGNLLRTLRDIRVVAKRNLKRIRRTPRLLIFSSIQPIMFLTLFRYVFGGAFDTGTTYAKFLVPGVFVQATLFGGTTAIALSVDLASGMVDRFRSLPIARSAVLAGRTIADTGRNIIVLTLLFIVGSLMGFRFSNGFFPAVACFAVALLFAYAYSWLSAFIGLVAKDPETAQILSFLPLFPFIFASTIFQPVSNFPSWMQGFAQHQPISVTVTTVRAFAEGGIFWNNFWSNFLQCMMWIAIFLIVFIPLSVRKYRQIS